MKERALPARIQGRFRELTLATYLMAIIVTLFGLARTFSFPASALALGWGLAAAGFGLMFVIRAVVSFLYNDGDYVEMWSTLSAFTFVVWAFAAFNWFGFLAAALVVGAWVLGKAGHSHEERLRLQWIRTRREALGSKRYPRRGLEVLGESALDLSERTQRRLTEDAFDQHPGTRRGSIERARMIDGNPWHLPPK